MMYIQYIISNLAMYNNAYSNGAFLINKIYIIQIPEYLHFDEKIIILHKLFYQLITSLIKYYINRFFLNFYICNQKNH